MSSLDMAHMKAMARRLHLSMVTNQMKHYFFVGEQKTPNIHSRHRCTAYLHMNDFCLEL